MSSGHPAAGRAAGWFPSTGVLVMDRSRADHAFAPLSFGQKGLKAIHRDRGPAHSSLYGLTLRSVPGQGVVVALFAHATNHPVLRGDKRNRFFLSVIEYVKKAILLGEIHHQTSQ